MHCGRQGCLPIWFRADTSACAIPLHSITLSTRRVQPFTYNTRISPYNGVRVNTRRAVVPGYTNNLLSVLTTTPYTVFGNTGLPWLP